MAIHLAGIRLKYFCGYKRAAFNFLDENDKPNRIVCIYGPNGEGKSSLLDAIKLVSNPYLYAGRDTRLVFRKLTYNSDYDPIYGFIKDAKEYITKDDYDNGFNDDEFKPIYTGNDFEKAFGDLVKDNKYTMEVEGAFDAPDGFKTVYIETSGLKKTNLPNKPRGYAYWIDADHPSNLTKFQVAAEMGDIFLDIAKTVYGFDCSFGTPVVEKLKDINGNEKDVPIYTDFIINKKGTKVHYKRMSAGEKKIATLLSFLCDPFYMENMDIIVVDNIELHIYFERHAIFIDKLLEKFPDKQFIITTHSGTMIQHIANKYGKSCLYPVHEIKEN
jgi:AAA15 family ATPase/GTPase